jgi:hypothetical protein
MLRSTIAWRSKIEKRVLSCETEGHIQTMANKSFHPLGYSIQHHIAEDKACKVPREHVIHNTVSASKRIEAVFIAKSTNFHKCSMEACKNTLYIHIRGMDVCNICAFFHVIFLFGYVLNFPKFY